jgi:hypothetical protein
MPEYPLRESATVAANSAGKAVARIGPTRAFETWYVESVAVQSNSTLTPVELREYIGDETDSRLSGTSRTGELDSGVNPNPIRLESGEALVYVWLGCSNGASCTVTIQGKRRVP